MNYDASQFQRDAEELGISLTDEQIRQFLRYYELLIEWNEKINLTAITEYQDVMKKHFIDSISLVKACDLNQEIRLIDVGTGAGFPGLALKIAFPNLEVTLLDSLNKRVLFLEAVVRELGLSKVETVHGRAEDLARQKPFRETFDLCVSRAVANLSTLSEYCLPFVKTGGQFISYKSEKISEEIENAEKAIRILGGRVERQVEFCLPASDIYRNLSVIKKVKETDMRYPRKAGVPGRTPL